MSDVKTVSDVLSEDFSGCPNNEGVDSREDTIERMDALEYGESLNEGETPRRLYPDRPSWTLTVSGSPPIHPHEPRKLTHRELASVQTFPKNYKFCGGKISVTRQIGNAAPPKMMKGIAESL